MKKIIVFEEEEFKQKMLEFCDNFYKQSKKGYGVKLIANENNEILDDKNSICGNLSMVWNETFKGA